ncbi:MAG: DUF5320 domain-containing protein [Deltaproteobacteria bacterium]|nr:DUF5320 domain-containing protein [Deltaproteobacteria bacterium]MBW1954449.1 DUF5320 domain-containing protein [Deltaproteobacteria bacterium]MBW2042511.1 DUF5320 domain-containing protein [Deltaproteobacteria bacterium]MBW2132334.1 DUF5320 domain-containing protein [Deltaproteobacteria bacterium]
MPRGDRTGPVGMGAMSGRAAGYCAGFGMPGYANPACGRGYGMGFGRGRGSWNRGFGTGGRGWRHWYHASGLPGWIRFGGYAAPSGYPAPYSKPDPEREKQALKSQADALQSELDFIKTRLAEVEAESAAK